MYAIAIFGGKQAVVHWLRLWLSLPKSSENSIGIFNADIRKNFAIFIRNLAGVLSDDASLFRVLRKLNPIAIF
jgi:hypothetical protein